MIFAESLTTHLIIGDRNRWANVLLNVSRIDDAVQHLSQICAFVVRCLDSIQLISFDRKTGTVTSREKFI